MSTKLKFKEELYNNLENPMQPLYKDHNETIRFKPNEIILHLYNTGKLNLNEIATLQFSDGDNEQIAQLLGYSIGGFAELSYVRNKTYYKAKRKMKKIISP